MIINLGPLGQNPNRSLPRYDSTGSPTFVDEGLDANGTRNWHMVYPASATLCFSEGPSAVDVFLVGGGGAGSMGHSWNELGVVYHQGGGGGAGGYRTTLRGVALEKNTNYSIKVGTAGEASTAFGATAAPGGNAAGSTGGAGTSSGGTGSVDKTAGSGAAGEYAFGEAAFAPGGGFPAGYRFGAGGGGGGGHETYLSKYGAAGAGGASGGGGGNGGSAAKNSGSGAGGGQASWGNPGTSAAGVVIIRNARS